MTAGVPGAFDAWICTPNIEVVDGGVQAWIEFDNAGAGAFHGLDPTQTYEGEVVRFGDFGTFLQARRGQLSQAYVAERGGIGQGAISDFENGAIPSPENAAKVCRGLGCVSLALVFCGSETVSSGDWYSAWLVPADDAYRLVVGALLNIVREYSRFLSPEEREAYMSQAVTQGGAADSSTGLKIRLAPETPRAIHDVFHERGLRVAYLAIWGPAPRV